MKKIIVLAIILAIGGAAGWYYYSQSKNSAIKYKTAKIERGDIQTKVSVTGTLSAVTTVQVGSQVSGTIQKLFADYNSIVKQSQVVAQLDPAIFTAQVSQARANLENAKASYENSKAGLLNATANLAKSKAGYENSKAEIKNVTANLEKIRVMLIDSKRNLERNRELYSRDLIAQSERDTAQTNYDSLLAQEKSAVAQVEAANTQVHSAQAQVDSASAQLEAARAQIKSAEAQISQTKAALELAEVNLKNTTILSPIHGIVISRNVDVGQTVAASFQAPVLFTIAKDLTKMQVEANVDEADIGRVKTNQEATFTVDAYPEKTFRGTVTQIRNSPTIVQNVVTYTTIIEVSNPQLLLKPGMTANVSIMIDRRENALKIPNAALRFVPEGYNASAKTEKTDSSKPSSETRERKKVFQGERPEFEKSARAKKSETTSRKSRVWIIGENNKLKAISVTIGISDGSFTELIEGNTKEGQEIIIEAQGTKKTSQTKSSGSSIPGFRMRK